MCDHKTIQQDAALLLVTVFGCRSEIVVAVTADEAHALAIKTEVAKMIQTCGQHALEKIVRNALGYGASETSVAGFLLTHYEKQSKTAAAKAEASKWN